MRFSSSQYWILANAIWRSCVEEAKWTGNVRGDTSTSMLPPLLRDTGYEVSLIVAMHGGNGAYRSIGSAFCLPALAVLRVAAHRITVPCNRVKAGERIYRRIV